MERIPRTRPIEGCDIIVRTIKFPNGAAKAFIIPNEDDTYSCYIDESLPLAEQRLSYEHEVDHIINDDFYNELSIEVIEHWQ